MTQDVLNRLCLVLAFSVGLLLCAVRPVRLQAQQDAGAITGTVLDQTGKIIQGAAVVVKNESTGFVRNLTTDAEGRFSAVDLPAGAYTIDVSAPRFATAARAGLQLAAGGTEDISISLKVADMAQTVTVEAVTVSSVAVALSPSGNTLEARPDLTIGRFSPS